MDMELDKLKERLTIACVLLCGTVFMLPAYDRVLTSRHIIFCAFTIVMVICTKKIRKIPIVVICYLVFVLLSGLPAINKSEWLYWLLRTFLIISYLSVVKIDKKALTKAMIVLGLIYTIYFWHDYFQTGNFGECRGLMRQRNYWAAAQFFVIPFCYYAYDKGFWKKASLFIAASMLVNIILLGSRSAFLAVFVSGIIVFIMNKKTRPYIAVAVICIAGVICTNSTLTSSESMRERLAQWIPTLDMIRQNPIGVGAGNWPISFPDYAHDIDIPDAYEKVNFRFPHNDFLWVGAETGIGGLVCYLGMFFTALYYAWKKKSAFLLMGILGYMAISFFSSPRERPFATLILMTFFAMSFGAEEYEIKYVKLAVVVLLFAIVVFGYRYRSSCWEKRLKHTTQWNQMAELTGGYSVFSTLTSTGQPWHWWWAVGNFKIGNEDLAISQFKQAYKHNPYNVRVINGMGLAMALEGKHEQAKMYFEKAIEICPKFEYAMLNLEKIQE